MSLCVQSSERMFGKSKGVLEMHRFYLVETVEYLTLIITFNASKSHCHTNSVFVDLLKKYTLFELNYGKSIR